MGPIGNMPTDGPVGIGAIGRGGMPYIGAIIFGGIAPGIIRGIIRGIIMPGIPRGFKTGGAIPWWRCNHRPRHLLWRSRQNAFLCQ